MVRFCHNVTRFDDYVLCLHHDVTRFDGYVLCFHHDELRSFFDLPCLGSFMTSSFSLYVIINTARQKKTSTHHDGNTTRNHQTSSHNEKTSPHNNVATVLHYDKIPKHQDKSSRPYKRIKITYEVKFPLSRIHTYMHSHLTTPPLCRDVSGPMKGTEQSNNFKHKTDSDFIQSFPLCCIIFFKV